MYIISIYFHFVNSIPKRGIPIFIEQLLAIESEAQDAMKDIAKENEQLTQKARQDLARRVAVIEHEGAEAIRRIVRETDTQTMEKIANKQAEFLAKTQAFEKDFEANKDKLRGKIFHDVLHGKP
jgi:Skp family chaperone for outer membrane proteins